MFHVCTARLPFSFIPNSSGTQVRYKCVNSKKSLGLHVKCMCFLSEFNDIWLSQQILIKASHITFDANPCSGSQVVPCGQTDGQI
jgi:hypothetical protein